MTRSNALRALLRIELRHVRAHRVRSLLVVMLVAAPTAAMVAGSTLVLAVKRTLEDQRNHAMGLAALRFEEAPGIPLERARASLPPDTRSAVLRTGIAVVARPGLRLRARSFALAPAALAQGGLASTMLRIERGRAPEQADEVALSPRVLHGLRVDVGDDVELNGRAVHVTGVAIVPEERSLPAAITTLAAPSSPDSTGALLVDVRAEQAGACAAAAQARGALVQRRSETGHDDAFEALAIFVCGSFGFFEAALVVGAAFAVGVRRRQRELGLLGANGAEPRSMARALLASAGALAALGSTLGVVCGAVAARLLHPHLNRWTDRDVGQFELPLRFVALAFALGVLSALLSAWLPARSAVQLPIRVALGGVRPIPAGSQRFLRVGAGLIGIGVLSVTGGAVTPGTLSGVWILGGAIVLMVGLGALSPWMLEALAKHAARLPIPWRLAVRDAGRFRARNGPVVTAVIAGMSISVLLGCLTASVEQLESRRRPALALNELRVDGALRWGAHGATAAADVAADDAPRADLEASRVTVAEVVARAIQAELGGTIRRATRLDDMGWFVETPGRVTEAQAAQAVDLAAAYGGASISAAALDASPDEGSFQVVLWICVVTSLIVIFAATTLSSVESAADAVVLRTVGAAPAVLRQHVACRAAYLALLGCALAVPAGLVPMAGLLRLSGGNLGFVMPWSTLALAVIAIPLIAYFGTWSVAYARSGRAA
ncbi:MAG: FtsX-like permease family protein [Planctomycetota bacterium]